MSMFFLVINYIIKFSLIGASPCYISVIYVAVNERKVEILLYIEVQYF